MDVFTKNKWLFRLVVFLILLNLGLLGFIARKNNAPANKNEQRADVLMQILRKELQLSEQQADQMKMIREAFFAREKILSAKIKAERDSMNQEMFNKNTNEKTVLFLAREIAENEYAMELQRLAQAKQLKNICTPQQQEKFQNLAREIKNYFKPEKKPRN